MVHGLETDERKDILKMALISSTRPHIPAVKRCHTVNTNKTVGISKVTRQKPSSKTDVLATEAYPEFIFKHKFSMLVIAPTQSGKTYFVKELLERDHIDYGNRKQRRILWYYGQNQPIYKEMKKTMGKEISFIEGLPEFEDNLSDLDDSFNNVIVLDDLMDLAKDSVIVSKLFTQGRHRNASVLLLLQNAFPKGRYNTDISRNAQYIALWRCSSDRKQIGMLADRIFEKRRNEFMTIYNRVTAEPYQYLLIDCKPDTPPNRQLISGVFGECKYFPNVLDRKQVTQPMEDMTERTQILRKPERNMIDTILQRNSQPGPKPVLLNPRQWTVVWPDFHRADTGANPPAGWVVWRIYITKATPSDSTYLPVLIKYCCSEEYRCYNAGRDWLMCNCPVLRSLL